MGVHRFGLAAAMAIGCAGAADAAELRLEFTGLTSVGEVAYAVHGSGAAWSKRGEAIASGRIPVRHGAAQVRVELPPGEYGVMAFHDRNANGRLDTLPIGLPTEPYGFSNDSRGTFGPPSWARARLRLTPTGAAQAIRLR